MKTSRPIHPDFQFFLDFKDQEVIDLFTDLREYIFELFPDCNELVYHTHALTAVFSISDKLSDAFCMLPIYTNHLNLGFNKGTLLKDPNKLLTGTGNLIRHIDIRKQSDYRNAKVKSLIKEAIDFAIKDMDKPTKSVGKTISKIKRNESRPHSRVGKGEFHPFASHRTVREALTSYGSCYAVNNSGHP